MHVCTIMHNVLFYTEVLTCINSCNNVFVVTGRSSTSIAAVAIGVASVVIVLLIAGLVVAVIVCLLFFRKNQNKSG